MRRRLYNIGVSRSRAIEIVMDHNVVSRDTAENYTDCEIKEVLKQLGLRAKF